MEKQHTHWTGGRVRTHPINRNHRDMKSVRSHNSTLLTAKEVRSNIAKKAVETRKIDSAVDSLKEVFSKQSTYPTPIDSEGYLYVDVESLSLLKGVRIKFVRREGRTKRTVGLQIEKQ